MKRSSRVASQCKRNGEGPVNHYGSILTKLSRILGSIFRPSRAALILSAVLMLRYLGEKEAADRIENAVRAVFTRGEVRTGDLGGKATTQQLVDAVLAEM